MSNRTSTTTPTTALTATKSPTTAVKNTTTTPLETTDLTTTSSTITVSLTSDPTTSSGSTTTQFVRVREHTTDDGTPGGAIAGGVVGGLVLIALIVLIVLLLRRRRYKWKNSKRSNAPLAPGKEEIARAEIQTLEQNHNPQPQPDIDTTPPNSDLYTNVDERGIPKESTDPALDSQGYLKSKSKLKKEKTNTDKVNEPYYVNKEKQPLYENNDTKDSGQEYYFEVQCDADTNMVTLGKYNYMDLSEHQMNATTAARPKAAEKANKTNNENCIKPGIASNKIKTTKHTPKTKPHKHSAVEHEHKDTDNVKTYKTERTVNTENVSRTGYVSDEEYVVPDPISYSQPKKAEARTYVNDKRKKHNKHKKTNEQSKENTDEINKEKGDVRESKYENIQNGNQYVNLQRTEEQIADEFYEVPENK